jgi:hypothetical protein
MRLKPHQRILRLMSHYILARGSTHIVGILVTVKSLYNLSKIVRLFDTLYCRPAISGTRFGSKRVGVSIDVRCTIASSSILTVDDLIVDDRTLYLASSQHNLHFFLSFLQVDRQAHLSSRRMWRSSEPTWLPHTPTTNRHNRGTLERGMRTMTGLALTNTMILCTNVVLDSHISS